ncbi:MAG TPA: hypothetical protein VL688_07650 [Verrucomicrobiae bacterium]|jgi:hypothetical protein|nr:hypothetical protein [Verrucomicrobiae bacterium]
MPKLPKPAENYETLRQQMLSLNWRKLGLQPTEKNPHVWGLLMEIGYPQAVVTLVVINQHNVSLFFGTGGGVVGGEKHEAVRMKAEEFLLTADTFVRGKKLNPTKHFPLPELNRVRFYALTFDGPMTVQDNRNISDETHELFPLFRSGHEVIAAMRMADEVAQSQASGNPEAEETSGPPQDPDDAGPADASAKSDPE